MFQAVNTFFQLLFSGNLEELVKFVGYIGVWSIIFAESGLLIGFFLPGDSLIFTAGILSSPALGFFNIWPMVIGAWLAAIIGDNVGYEFGKRVGRKLFVREKSFLFNPVNLQRAQDFYDRHGGIAIVLARFVPVVRTFAPMVAGIGHMDHKKFTLFNALGGTLWTWAMAWGGYFLGSLIGSEIDKYLLPVVALIIFMSVFPAAWHFYKDNKTAVNKKALDYMQSLRYRLFK